MTGVRLKRKVSTSASEGPRKKVAKHAVCAKRSQLMSSRPKRQHPAPTQKKLPITSSLEAQNEREESSSGGEDVEDDTTAPHKATEVDSLPVPTSSSESHRMQKSLAKERRASKPNAQLITKAKSQWSLAHQKNISKSEREKHINELMATIRGKVQDVIFKHDASRVVQTVVKYGTSSQRGEIVLELKGRYRDLVQNKYAKFLVTKLLRYCPAQRSLILSELQLNLLKLLLHREASPIVSDAYDLYTNSAQRQRMLKSLYGKEVTLFQESETTTGGFKELLEKSDAEKRKRILAALKENLLTIFNNSDKGTIGHAIVHRALWEYLQSVNWDSSIDVEEKDRRRREIFERVHVAKSCQELVAEMVHTKDGSRAVREFLAQGTAKDRKQIIKVLKPHLERMCSDEEAQLVLFTALDVIDDTKLVAKSFVSEITSRASSFVLPPTSSPRTLSSHSNSLTATRRAILYLLIPRSSRYFPPSLTSILAATDEARSRTSRKDMNIRMKEIREAASDDLVQLVSDKADGMLRDPAASLVLSEIMLFAEGDKSKAIDTLLALVSKSYPTTPSLRENGELTHLIDIPHSSRVFKVLIQGGHFSKAENRIVLAPSWDAPAFASRFVESCNKNIELDGREMNQLARMALGDGVFVITELIRCMRKDGSEDDRAVLKGVFREEFIESIKDGPNEVRGRESLIQEMTALHMQ